MIILFSPPVCVLYINININIYDIMFETQGTLIDHMGNMHLDPFPHIQQDNFFMTL